MRRLRSQIIRQIVKKIRRNPDGFQGDFVRVGGKDVGKMRVKASAAMIQRFLKDKEFDETACEQVRKEDIHETV